MRFAGHAYVRLDINAITDEPGVGSGYRTDRFGYRISYSWDLVQVVGMSPPLTMGTWLNYSQGTGQNIGTPPIPTYDLNNWNRATANGRWAYELESDRARLNWE